MVFGFGRKKKQWKWNDTGDNNDRDPRREGEERASHSSNASDPGVPSNRGLMGTLPPPPSAASFSLTLDKIPEILSEFDGERQQRTVSAIRKVRDEVEPLIEELIRMGKNLERDDLDVDSIDKHLAIIVVRGKRQVIDVIRRGVVPLPEVNSIEDAVNAESALRHLLKKVGDVLGRQTRVIHIFAKKHANRFKDNLEDMNSQHATMRHIMDRHNQADAESEEITDALTRVRKRQDARSKRLQKTRDLLTAIDSMGSRISAIESSIRDARSSEGYRKYVALLSDIKECNAQMDGIREEINSQFAKISRPLGRYEYGSSLDKEQQKVLEGLVADPAAVVRPANIKTISAIISNVRRAVATGSISVRDVEKVIAVLAETAEVVGTLADRISECDARRQRLVDGADSVKPPNLDEYERDLSKSISLRKDDESRLSMLHTDLKNDDSAISNMISDIQVRLRQYTGLRYEIAAPTLTGS